MQLHGYDDAGADGVVADESERADGGGTANSSVRAVSTQGISSVQAAAQARVRTVDVDLAVDLAHSPASSIAWAATNSIDPGPNSPLTTTDAADRL